MKTPCVNCGGDVPIEQESLIVACPYCESRLYVDLGKSVLHYRMQPALDVKAARHLLASELAGLGLPRACHVRHAELLYLPFWNVESRLRSAAAAPPRSLLGPPMPSGDLKFFEPGELPPEQVVLPEAHLLDAGDAKPMLLHLPFVRASYEYAGRKFEVHVDAVGGRVLADEWPVAPLASRDWKIDLTVAAASAIFLAEGFFISSAWSSAGAIALTAVPLAFLAGKASSR